MISRAWVGTASYSAVIEHIIVMIDLSRGCEGGTGQRFMCNPSVRQILTLSGRRELPKRSLKQRTAKLKEKRMAQACTMCKGKKKCTLCDGEGVMSQTKARCVMCNGSGRCPQCFGTGKE